MATNNNGNLLDSSGNVCVDYVWGNFPMQPNDERPATGATVVVAANASENKGWSGYTVYPSGRLDPALDTHITALADWSGYPSFIPAGAKYAVTAASGNGTTVTYTSQNNFKAGDLVTITGLTVGALNLTGATVASANAVSFTVTNSATGSVTGNYGIATNVTNAAAEDGAFVSGTAYVLVPSALGQTSAVATDTLKDAGLGTITVATAATNTPITVTAVSRTAGSSTATVTATGAGAAFPVGTKVTIASITGGTEFQGDWTVTASATNSVSFVSNGTSAVSLTGLTGSIKGTTGTVKTQSVAAGAASIAVGAAVTITPWA